MISLRESQKLFALLPAALLWRSAPYYIENSDLGEPILNYKTQKGSNQACMVSLTPTV